MPRGAEAERVECDGTSSVRAPFRPPPLKTPIIIDGFTSAHDIERLKTEVPLELTL